VATFLECFTFWQGHILSTTGDALTLVQDWYYLRPLIVWYRRRVNLEVLPCFVVPGHGGGSPSVGHWTNMERPLGVHLIFIFFFSSSFQFLCSFYTYTLLLPILIPLLVLGAGLCIGPTLVQTTNLRKLGGRVVVSCMYQRVDRGEATGKQARSWNQPNPTPCPLPGINNFTGVRVYKTEELLTVILG
jgi:hypothetical protein